MATWTNRWDKDYKDPYGKPLTCAEWYDTHDSAKPFRDRSMKALNQLRFKSGIWQPVYEKGFQDGLTQDSYTNDPVKRFMRFVNDVRKLAGMPPMTGKQIREGLRYRHPFANNYDYALEEMWLLCWFDW